MDTVYYTSGTLMTLLTLGLVGATLVFLVRPHLLNNRKVVKKPLSRLKIFLVGVSAITCTLLGFGTVLAATEPAHVKQARAAQEGSLQKGKADIKTPVVKIETKTESIPFETTQQDSDTIAKGETKVLTEGSNGERTVYYSVTYVDGKETARSVEREEVTKGPVTKVIANGTYVAPAPQAAAPKASSCNPNYSGCVPNVSYDLDCKDIDYTVQVLGTDVYRLDGDKDGWGCE